MSESATEKAIQAACYFFFVERVLKRVSESSAGAFGINYQTTVADVFGMGENELVVKLYPYSVEFHPIIMNAIDNETKARDNATYELIDIIVDVFWSLIDTKKAEAALPNKSEFALLIKEKLAV